MLEKRSHDKTVATQFKDLVNPVWVPTRAFWPDAEGKIVPLAFGTKFLLRTQRSFPTARAELCVIKQVSMEIENYFEHFAIYSYVDPRYPQDNKLTSGRPIFVITG